MASSVSKRKIKSFVLVSLGGIATFTGISIYKGNEKFYKQCIMPLVHRLEPEKAHRLAIFIGKHRLFPKCHHNDNGLLVNILSAKKIFTFKTTNVFGIDFPNPVGIAAGFDKHAEAVIGLVDLGFGFVEIGSVTPKPQPGNEKPRVFRLTADKAIINRYGFNSEGHDVVLERLEKLRKEGNFKGIIGVNLGKNKTSEDAAEDYVKGIEKFRFVADYLVINVSSPNTPGLRNLQAKEALEDLLKKLVKARNSLQQNERPPLLLKLAPDLTQEERRDIASILQKSECRVDGLIISNTTTDRPKTLKSEGLKEEIGGLSGAPLKNMSTQMIADMYRLTNKMTIIGVGGISSGEDAYEKIKAGASMVQLYTAMIYEGPTVLNRIKRELKELLDKDGYSNISEAVGRNIT